MTARFTVITCKWRIRGYADLLRTYDLLMREHGDNIMFTMREFEPCCQTFFSQNIFRMQPDCCQNVVRCSQNLVGMQSECSQSVVRMQSECRQNVVRWTGMVSKNSISGIEQKSGFTLNEADCGVSVHHFKQMNTHNVYK